MTYLLPLVICWLLGAVLLLLNGKKPWVCYLATLGLVLAVAIDVYELFRLIANGLVAQKTVTGGWAEGVGIRLRVDRMSLFFAIICGAVLTAVMAHETRAGVRSRLFPAHILLLSAGLHGAFFTGDLFNFYVFFELSVVTSFALAAYGYGRAEIRATFIYIVLNLLGSVLFLIGVANIYHATGTLDFAEIAAIQFQRQRTLALPATLLFTALTLKLGLFPFHGWVPVLYSNARPAVVAALAGALVNIGAYGLLRIGFFPLSAAREDGAVVLLFLGATATVYGSILAVSRREPARLAAYTAIVHAGHIVLAIGIGGRAGIAAALLTVLAGSIDKTAMFLSFESNLGRRRAAFVAGSSLAGIPPTAGFLSKVYLIFAALQGPVSTAIVTIIVLSGILVLVAAFRFWRMLDSHKPERGHATPGLVPLLLVLISIAIGLYPAPATDFAWLVSGELLEGDQ